MASSQYLSAAPRRRKNLPLFGYGPLLPSTAILLIFFALPVGMMIGLSLENSASGTLGIENYRTFFADDLALDGLWRTIAMSGIVAVCVTAMAYPIAYFLARSTSFWRTIVLGLAIAPELAGVVLRTYGWLIILEKNGFINTTLLGMGIIQEPIPLVGNMFGAVVGLTHVLLPFGILSLLTSIQGIDQNLEKSAQILGASRLSVLRHVVLPLSLPGIISSFLIAFTLSASAYATPALLGGAKFRVLATMIYREVMVIVDWPAAATMAVVLLLIVLGIAFLSARLESRLVSRLRVR